MAGREEDDLGALGKRRTHAVHLGCQLRLGRPEVEQGHRLQSLPQERAVGRHQCRELVEDAADLLVDRRLGLAPGIAQLHDDERLHEQRLAAARGVVDDALHLAAGLGPDRDHVASIAQGDDRLLQRPAQLGAHEAVQPAPQAVVGDPHGAPQPAQPRRRGVQELADRVEAAPQRAAQGRQRVEAAAKVPQERPPFLGQGGRKPRGGLERLHDLHELLRVEAPAAHGPTHPGVDVMRSPDADPRPVLEQGTRLVGLVEAAGDDEGVRRGNQGLGHLAGRIERGLLGQAGANQGELEQRDRPRVHVRAGG